MGTMPPTALLLINGCLVVGSFDSYSAIGHYLGVSCDDDGVITFLGVKRNPSYILEHHEQSACNRGFTKDGAIRDWSKRYMQSNMHNYQIYRYLI